jgi:hypothetical protein
MVMGDSGRMLLLCQKCQQNVEPNIIPTTNGTTTTYKAVCPICNGYIKWVSKSVFEGTKKPNGKRRKAAWSAKILGIDYCELCGRREENLGVNEKLESHHKVPIEHGGEDVKENILILCSPCHRMAHFLRTYLNDHLCHLYESENQDGRAKCL